MHVIKQLVNSQSVNSSRPIIQTPSLFCQSKIFGVFSHFWFRRSAEELMGSPAPSEWASVVTFTLNRRTVELLNPDPQLKLIDFLRDQAHLTGTKLSCGEGGCGACTVVLCNRPLDHVASTMNSTGGPGHQQEAMKATEVVYRAVNACLFPVCALDGIAVTTVEGIGSTSTSLHAVQNRLVKSNGMQCGFCTPGWVMNMYELLRQYEGTKQSNKLTKQVVEDHFDGNLCRCTGYRPIFEAFHSFAVDKDAVSGSLQLEYDDDEHDTVSKETGSQPPMTSCGSSADHHLELLQTCDHFEDWLLIDSEDIESGRKVICEGKCAKHLSSPSCSKYLDLEDLIPHKPDYAADDSVYHAAHDDKPSEFIINFTPRPLKFEDKQKKLKWYRPLTLEQLFEAIQDGNDAHDVMFIGGRTAYGVSKYYNNTAPYNRPDEKPVQIELNYIAELKSVTVHEDEGHAVVGAAVTINSLLAFLQSYDGAGSEALTELGTLIQRVANNQVRNSGTWAGNLSLCRQHPSFVSDIAVGLMGLGTTLTLVNDKQEKQQSVHIEDFLSKPLSEFALIVSMNLPLYSIATAADIGDQEVQAHQSEVFKCYKVAQRAQNAHSHVNCAIWMRLKTDKTPSTVTKARVVFGGVCTHPARFPLTEKALIGNSITTATVTAAMEQLDKDVEAIGTSEAFGSQDFRLAAMKNLLYKTLVASLKSDTLADPTVASASSRLSRKVSSGVQSFKPSDATGPVSQPIQKIGAKWQVSGEAQYVADKELNSRALYGSILYSRKALGKLLVIDEGGSAHALMGVVDILTSADIPGKNDVSGGANDEPLFVPIGGIVRCIGQPIGVIIATSQEIAEKAVAICKVTYGDVPSKDRWKNQSEPIVNIDMAMEADTLGMDDPIVMGDPNVRAKLSESPFHLSGELFLGAQKHFYMEPQVSTVSVQEGNVLLIETSSQFPVFVQQNVASLLDVHFNMINVKVQRAGGGFGGKLTRCVINAAAAALAAQKHRCTVRVLNDRSADFRLVGGRENMKGTYSIGFDKNGYVHALDLALHVDCGFSVWDSVDNAQMAVQWADSAYHIPSFRCQGFLYLTNTQSCTSHRAPGVPQALVLVETALNHVATYLDLPMKWVQERNLYKEYNRTPYQQLLTEVRLQEVWDRLIVSSRVEQREEKNALFNSNNKWKKRGIAVTPTKYGMAYSGRKDGSKVDIFAGDGSVVISHGGCEVGQVRPVTLSLSLSRYHDSSVAHKTHCPNVMTLGNPHKGRPGLCVRARDPHGAHQRPRDVD